MIPPPSWRTLTLVFLALATAGMLVGEDSVLIACGMLAIVTFTAHIATKERDEP